ncbi:MAG TPA: hypothetical protein VGY54_20235, partial [Polyangiaceae bacterium]|nr:hypothetical protein [Polyangiaceae bacterium]
MILGVVASTDRVAASIVERAGAPAEVSFSVASGVAIACWGCEPAPLPCAFAGDHAWVGLAHDGPGARELRGDFAMIARSRNILRMTRGRFGGRPLFWTR